MPRAPCALAMTEAEGICVSFRDQSADGSWESVIPLRKSKGDADCHTSDIGHWFAMTGFFQGVRCKSGRRGEGTPPYNHTLCRAGPVFPAGGAVENRFGSSGRPTPTLHSTIELRRGGVLPRPSVLVQISLLGVGADGPVRPAVVLFSLSLLHFSWFCGILGVFNLVLKEFSPWKP